MKAVPVALRERLDADLRSAAAIDSHDRADGSWTLLEEAHILSQPWARPHVRVHWHMLLLAVRTRDGREVAGQLVRLLAAGPASLAGRYPVGNTGRARVSMTKPMPVPTEVARLLDLSSGDDRR